MAILIPEVSNKFDFTYSEALLFKYLGKLSDDYLVLHSIPWVEKSMQGNLQKVGEADFVVFKKGVGFLVCEVKGGLGISFENGQWLLKLSYGEHNDSDKFISEDGTFSRKLNKSPFSQAQKSMYYFINYFKKMVGKDFQGVFGYFVSFPLFDTKDFGLPDAPNELILSKSHLENLPERIESFFDFFRKKKFSKMNDEDLQRFTNLMLKKRVFTMKASDVISKLNYKMDLLEDDLKRLFHFTESIDLKAISGAAGCGKTFLAKIEADERSKNGEIVLLLCFNVFLANELKAKNKNRNIEIYYALSFFKDFIGSSNYENLSKKDPFIRDSFDRELFKKFIRLKYKHIIIDEAQDFVSPWLSFFKDDLLEENGTMTLYFDPEQQIFDGGVVEFVKERNIPEFKLSHNIRNTKEIFNQISLDTEIGKDVIRNELNGPLPEILNFDSQKELVENLESLISKLLNEDKFEARQIIVISNITYARSWIKELSSIGGFPIWKYGQTGKSSKSAIEFATSQSFKGLEKDIVIYLKHKSPGSSNKVDYVSMSRAKNLLFVITLNE